MILIDNINYLRENFPSVREKLKIVEESENKKFFVEDTRKGDKTLYYIKDNKKIYFHSKYNPIREAEAIIGEHKEIHKDTNIIFYGTGLGYHIDLFIKKYPDNNFYIFEPIPELMQKFLSIRNLSRVEYKNLRGINVGLDNIASQINRFLDLNRKEVVIIDLPIHKKNFKEEFNKFNNMFLKIIKQRRRGVATNYSFQKRWIVNSMKNFGDVLSTPNIIVENKDKFKNKPALLVAAGPSLNEEIENIRYIKENGLAYIFSVGSAINTLIHHDIYPHAATTYDPTERNQIVFQKAKEMKIKDIPMIFGSSVGYETLDNYLGKKSHMITSQDTIANYYLKTEGNEDINIVQDAPSIAVVTLQLLSQLGFNPIILVGQNLAYKGKAKHSEGVHYSSELTEEEMDKGIYIKDVYGEKILTNDAFNSMRQQMESYVKVLPNIKVINTTKGGASIEGTEFTRLNKIMKNQLLKKVVEDSWLLYDEINYDKKHLDFKLKKMDRDYEKALKVNKEYRRILNRIKKAVNNRNFQQVENLYVKLDKELKRIENNDFYKVFILPMNRVQYKLLADNINNLNEIRSPYNKGNKIVESFTNFIDICEEDIELVNPIYEEMKENIRNFINNENGEENV